MELTQEQRQAVQRTGQDVCVVAGPGSGKTRVLTERFAWLVEQWQTDPTRILAITFTEKAATEIKARLIKRFEHSAEHREAVERAWVSTIHGFCTRLLREHAIAAGLAPNFVVLDQAPATRMQREAAEAALDEMFAERPSEMRRLMEAVDLSTSDDGRQDDLAAALLKIYDAMRTAGVEEIPANVQASGDAWARARELAVHWKATSWGWWAEQFLALTAPPTWDHLKLLSQFHPVLTQFRKIPAGKELRDEIKPRLEAQWLAELNADLHQLLREAIRRIDQQYREQKRREAVLDFSDLEEYSVRLLESHAGILFETRARFDEVLMDELQDTNPVQWKLVELVKSRLFAVGDINQSIYGFRYADPTLFAAYRDGLLDYGLTVDELRDNYRSRPQILEVVSSMLNAWPGIEPRELHAMGDFEATNDVIVERFEGQGESREDAEVAEAAMVASRIQEWRSSGKFAYKDIALLVRTFAAAEAFERAFDEAGIPYLLSGGRGFLEARETRDVLMLLAALVNANDEIPLIGVLRGPLFGLSDEELYRMGRTGWRRVFEDRFAGVRQLAGFVAPDQLIARALDACDWWATLGDRQRSNVEKLLAWIRREHHNNPRTLAELLEALESLRETQSASTAPPPEAGDVVRIMTIHAAKGLEFPVVFVTALHRGTNLQFPALLFSARDGLGVRWRNPMTGKGAADPLHDHLREQAKTREDAEADRLLYVAMTRAEQRLVLSHVDSTRGWVPLARAGVPDAWVAAEAPVVEHGTLAEERSDDPLLMPPVVSQQYDSTASVTSVAIFAACPRRYYLSRYLGLEPEPDGPGTGAIQTGLSVHEVLAGKPAASAEVQRLADNFRNSEWGQRAARAERAEHEFDFLFACEDIVLRGQIDLWFEEGGELVLVDYKTDRDESSSASYALQLQIYALGLEPYVGRLPDRAILFYVRSSRVIEVSLSGEDLENSKGRVGELREAQERQEFPMRPGDQCQKCPFWSGMCPEGRGEGVKTGLIFGPPSSSLAPQSNGS